MVKVKFTRKKSADIDETPIEDGQLLYDYETGNTFMDYGTKRVSTGGKLITNYEDLENLPKINNKKLIGDISLNDLGVVQSDWNQNDTESLDHIKNRPFHEIINIVEETALEEADRNFIDSGGDTGNWYYNFTDDETNTMINILNGKTNIDFVLNIDDVEYTNSYYKDEEGVWRSNQWISNGSEVSTLSVSVNAEYTMNIVGIPEFCGISAGTHKVSLKCTSEVPEITKIPEKFLPDGLATKADIEEAVGIALGGSY